VKFSPHRVPTPNSPKAATFSEALDVFMSTTDERVMGFIL